MMNLYLADGIMNYFQTSGNWILGLVMIVVGFGLVIAAVIDLWAGLGHTNKDFKKAGVGILVGIVGGLLMIWGTSGIIGFFKGLGQSIPHN
jgi:hypothetical protein